MHGPVERRPQGAAASEQAEEPWWLSRWTQVALLGLLTLATRYPTLLHPYFDSDETIYGVIAHGLLHGDRLYADLVDRKPPLIYWTYAAVYRLFGLYAWRALHLVTMLVVLATALLVGRLAAQLAPEAGRNRRARATIQLAAGGLYVIFAAAMYPQMLASHVEVFLALPLAAGTLILRRSLEPAGRPLAVPALTAVASGVLVAVAGLYRQTVGYVALGYVAILFRERRPHLALAFTAGGLLAVGTALLPFVLSGTVADALRWSLTENLFHHVQRGQTTAQMLWLGLGRTAWYAATHAALIALAGVGLWRGRRGQRFAPGTRLDARAGALIVAWLIGAAASVATSGRFAGHMFLQLTVPLAVVAGVAWGGCVGRPVVDPPGPSQAAPAREAGLRTFFVAGVAIPALVHPALAARNDWVQRVFGVPAQDFPAIGAYLEARSSPEDRLVVWGASCPIFFHARRLPGARFVFSDYVSGRAPGLSRGEVEPARGAMDLFLADLARRRPRFFVDTSTGYRDYRPFPPRRYPRLRAWLEEHYRAEAVVDGCTIYRRRKP